MAFEPLDQQYIDFKKEHPLYIFRSLNQPQMSPEPGKASEAASSTLFVVQDDQERLRVYIGLFFEATDIRLMYGSYYFSSGDLKERLEAGKSFVEEMGFMIDDTHFAKASNEEQAELLRQSPFAYEKIRSFYDAMSSTEVRLRKVSKEASAHRDLSADLERTFIEQYVRLISML